MLYYIESLPPDRRLRANLADLFVSNDVSAARAQSLFADAEASSAKNVADLAKAGHNGKHGTNLARDLTRKLLNDSRRPLPYNAQVRTWNTKAKQVELHEVPILLPHEIVWAIAQDEPTSEHLLRQELCTQDQDHLNRVCVEMGCNPEKALGPGLWGDGVPYNYDRTVSIDVFSLSVRGFHSGALMNMRIPLFVLDHRHVGKGATLDDLMEVLAWSFTFLVLGKHPVARHDNTPFHTRSGRSRLKQAGSSINLHGILVECRGDWKQLKDVFRFTQFNENAGCWLCACTPQVWRLVGDGAPWRHNRLDHWAFLERLRAQGFEASPLFADLVWRLRVSSRLAPCTLWTSVWLAIIYEICCFCWAKQSQEPHKRPRWGAMWQHIQGWYKDQAVENRLDNPHPTMLQAETSNPPKLRAKAAQARGLVPYASFAAAGLLKSGLVDALAASMANELAACYGCLTIFFGYVCLLLGIFDYFWVSLVIFWVCLPTFGYLWLLLGIFDYLLNIFEYFWVSLVMFGSFWILLFLFVYIWLLSFFLLFFSFCLKHMFGCSCSSLIILIRLVHSCTFKYYCLFLGRRLGVIVFSLSCYYHYC